MSGGGRLPSFRGPRDLTLGGTTKGGPSLRGGFKVGTTSKGLLGLSDPDKKKKFTPNLNVQRKDTSKSISKEASTAPKEQQQQSGWKKPALKPKERAKPNLIQVSGAIFADGLGSDAEAKKRSGWGSRGSGDQKGGESKANMERPKINLNAKYDKAEEEQKLKELLRDDFIDDLKTGHLVPIQLPMINTGKVFKEVKKSESSTIKLEANDDEIKRTTKMKKNVILDSDDEDDIETSKLTSNNVETKTVIADPTISELMSDQRGELLFFQLPDHLPNRTDVKREECSKNVLGDLPEGYLGKLQIRKSGKSQLWINSTLFDVDVGTQVGFLQELFVIDTNVTQQQQNNSAHFTKGSMTNLGRVRNRVVTTPAWTDLFSCTNLEASSSDEDDA